MEQVQFAKLTHDPSGNEPGTDGYQSGTQGQKRTLFRLLAQAEEKERRRIALELHDTTAQDLVAVDLNLRQIAKACEREHVLAGTTELFRETTALLKQVQQDLRTMSYVLHPPPVSDAGLAVALGTLAEGMAKRSGLQAHCAIAVEGRFEPRIEEALYRVAQEALLNVCRHARAENVWLRCRRRGDRIELEVEDDGIGCEMGGGAPLLGVGLRAIRARARVVGGRFGMSRLAKGTLIRVSVPVPSHDVQ